jgi:hypothetical protein
MIQFENKRAADINQPVRRIEMPLDNVLHGQRMVGTSRCDVHRWFNGQPWNSFSGIDIVGPCL